MRIKVGCKAGAAMLAALALMLTAEAASHATDPEGVTPAEALSRLAEGNTRFAGGRPRQKDYAAERTRLVAGQHPYAVVLACADSRVPPEILFDESLGRLFVVRVAGNVVDPAVLGSVEYAVEHLGVRLLFVLGHDGCGAVKATLTGGEFPPNIDALRRRIAPAVENLIARHRNPESLLRESVRENVRYQMQMAAFESAPLEESIESGRLRVAGGVYRLTDGLVEMVGARRSSPEERARGAAAPAAPPPHSAAPETVGTHVVPAGGRGPEEKAEGERAARHHDSGAAVEELVRRAYERKHPLVLRRSLVMRDQRDGCLTAQCPSIPAGEQVRVESPHVLSVGGRPQLRVRYKGRVCYVHADGAALASAPPRSRGGD